LFNCGIQFLWQKGGDHPAVCSGVAFPRLFQSLYAVLPPIGFDRLKEGAGDLLSFSPWTPLWIAALTPLEWHCFINTSY